MQELGGPVSRSPSGEARWPRQRVSAQEATLGQAASWGFARSVQQQADAEQSVQEANSLPAPGAHHGHMLAGAFSGAVPALSIIQGQLEPFRPAVDGPSSEGGDQGEGPQQQLTGSGRLSPHLLGQLENAASLGADNVADFNGALPAQNSAMLPRKGLCSCLAGTAIQDRNRHCAAGHSCCEVCECALLMLEFQARAEFATVLQVSRLRGAGNWRTAMCAQLGRWLGPGRTAPPTLRCPRQPRKPWRACTHSDR